MTQKKVAVFLAGEGKNELGSRVGPPAFQTGDHPGVLQILLERVQPTGWEVKGARTWASVRKLRVGRSEHRDEINVLAIALDAKEAGCDVLAFSRDRDRDEERAEAIKRGIARVEGLDVIGGVAIPTLEGWLLALMGERRTEELSPTRAEELLTERGTARKSSSAMAVSAESCDLDAIPDDAWSLRAWLDRARDVLPRLVAQTSGP